MGNVLLNLIIHDGHNNAIELIPGLTEIPVPAQQMRRKAFDDLKQDRPKQIDIRVGTYTCNVFVKQFRCHVNRRSAATAEIHKDTFPFFKSFGRDRQTPIQHYHLTVLTDNHILRLQIPVYDAS